MKIIITPHSDRKVCGISPCRQIVAKNFPEYRSEDLFELNKLCFGIMVKQMENELYALYLSTCEPYDRHKWWCLESKETHQICLQIQTLIEDDVKIELVDKTIVLDVVLADERCWGIDKYDNDCSLYSAKQEPLSSVLDNSIEVVDENVFISVIDSERLYLHCNPEEHGYSVPVICMLY